MDDLIPSAPFASPAHPDAVHWVRYDRLLLVWLRGPIDQAHCSVLADVRASVGRDDRVVLDLSAVTFFGATALNFLSALTERVYAPVIVSDLPHFARVVLTRAGMQSALSLPAP